MISIVLSIGAVKAEEVSICMVAGPIILTRGLSLLMVKRVGDPSMAMYSTEEVM